MLSEKKKKEKDCVNTDSIFDKADEIIKTEGDR